MPKSTDENKVRAMYEMYKSGKSLREVGEHFDTTMQTVHAIFKARGLPRRSSGGHRGPVSNTGSGSFLATRLARLAPTARMAVSLRPWTLQRLTKASGKLNKQLAQEIGVSESWFNKLVRASTGKSSGMYPDIRLAKRISDVLGVPIDEPFRQHRRSPNASRVKVGRILSAPRVTAKVEHVLASIKDDFTLVQERLDKTIVAHLWAGDRYMGQLNLPNDMIAKAFIHMLGKNVKVLTNPKPTTIREAIHIG